MQQLLPIREVAMRLGVSRQLIHRWIADERMPAIRYGREWLVKPAHCKRPQQKKMGRPPIK